MSGLKGTKNKLFKGLTEHDILVWEEEKMRHQRRMGRKVTDVEFLREEVIRRYLSLHRESCDPLGVLFLRN